MGLTEECGTLVSTCVEASEWVRRNAELVHNEGEGLLKTLRHSRRLFSRLETASRRKMCAGVFGPSQAGKSYLISALARDSRGSLMARFGSELHDFIQEINPEGGKESTGLVTRFTMTTPSVLPEGNPVQVRLLTETDIVKIIANTYFADCEHKVDNVSDIDATLSALEKKKGSGGSHIDLDALEDLQEYLKRDFLSKARVALLQTTYWERAFQIGPTLGLEDRIALYALIWDEVPQFTHLLGILLRALESLGHPDVAYCPISALIPREGSIIDVATLEGIDDEDAECLDVVTPEGKRASLQRAVVTALTAELTIVMDQKPADYFETTDLLDFPGYRSRYKIDDIRKELEKPGMLKEMFLRGKVAYLFQRYCFERELTSMLLCIGPSNQEVQDLPGVINDWVTSTHGEKPDLRSDHPVSLFFILTKFDMEFEQKKGAPSVETRWDNRLHASLLDFFGKQHDWPKSWDLKGGFRNCFLLRNPNFRFDAILNYDADGREESVREEMKDYVVQLETAFMQSSLVAEHFRNPREAWDAAMRLNDGGISYIREALSPLCDPELKQAQLAQSMREEQARLHTRLKGFYHSDDREEELKRKYALIKLFFARLGRLEKEHQRMGKLLRALTISDAEIYELHPEAFRRYLEEPEITTNTEETGGSLDLNLDLDSINVADWNPFAEQNTGSDKEEDPASSRDEALFFADYVMSHWTDRLHAIADDVFQQSYFMLSAQEFSAFVGELATGAKRLGVREDMLDSFRRASAYVNTQKESIVWQQSSMAAHILNSYIDWLGFDPQRKTKEERTIAVGQSQTVVFEPREDVEDELQLGEERQTYTTVYYRDWFNALYTLLIGNASFDGEREVNVEENLKLGAILKHFSG
ncbi:MAG: putative virulence factor [Desulfovibrio sp.]|nr:putative virulence factor [Desulfovibrio sp.]